MDKKIFITLRSFSFFFYLDLLKIRCSCFAGTYKEYHILHPHKQIAPTTIGLLIEGDDESAAIPVELLYCKKNKDPLKNVGVSEFKLDADKKIVLGIDLNGDVVEKKS